MADFCLVDVFGTARFSGNPLPVLFDADGLSDAEMQRITRWFGFSETAFLVAPTEERADYRVRIFTLDRELPFAGHPTLGACHAWRTNGGAAKGDTIVQQCGAGLIEIRAAEGGLAFAAPPLIRTGPVDEAEVVAIANFLGIERGSIVDSQWVDNGPGWVAVLLASAADVLAINPPASAARRFEVGVVGPHSSGEAAYEVRSLFSDHRGGIIEDPITGSLNASLAQWLTASGRFTPPYFARQGTALGRDGRIMIDRDDAGQIWVGGQTLTIASGSVDI
jgi:PhzF family phenazine biosynthesis protein